MHAAHLVRRSLVLALPTAAVGAALIATPSVAATPSPTTAAPSPIIAPAPTTTGIIMRDGGVCDPIRHMGC